MTPRDASDDSRWSDLDRPPLNAAALRRGLVREGGLWREVEVVQRTGSTNTDLVALATEGKAAEGAVLVAEEQTAGKGRLDRQWTAPARSGLFFSVLLDPAEVPAARWGWLPLLTGVAVATGLSRAAGVDTALKWPNDLLVTVDGEERKAGGILAERAGDAGVVIGVGINVTLRDDELPVPQAASLALAGAVSTDRDPLLRGMLRSLEEWYGRWRAAAGDPVVSEPPGDVRGGLRDAGEEVRAELPGGRTYGRGGRDRRGRAAGDRHRRGDAGAVGAGDIVHLRPGNGRSRPGTGGGVRRRHCRA